MKTALHMTASAAVLAFAGLAATLAYAANTKREIVSVAPAACQPFFSTTQARYSASGLTNAGASPFYVVCSTGGSWQESANNGNDYMAIYVSNPTANAVTVNCTARPGYVVGTESFQKASPKSQEIPAGSSIGFTWTSINFGVTTMGNANFTCALPPGLIINLVHTIEHVEIGT